MPRVLITGGAGFIGSHLARQALRRRPDWSVVVLDALTYAGNLDNLRDLRSHPRFRFVRGDIADAASVGPLLSSGFALVFNLAAETHVDRSIDDPEPFLRTGIHGTRTLLEAARRRPPARFIQASTDEVYGSVARGLCGEEAPLRPSSPYAACKAAADGLAYAYRATYGVPTLVARACNTYGAHQHPEKMIPLFITNALEGLPLPLYGDGGNVRDWLHVEDHCEALLAIAERGEVGAIYNVGAGDRRSNRGIARAILAHLGRPRTLIRRVADRPGHDRRYALDSARLRGLGWVPRVGFARGLRETIAWYRDHRRWWEPLRTGARAEYYRRRYGPEIFPPPPGPPP